MKGLARKALKYTGYGAFFVVALVFFFYLTLPMDTMKDYLVRKASDEYNADLEITELSTWSLTGIEAEGVTITPRPSAEDLEKMRLAREAREAWLSKQKQQKEDDKKAKAAKAAAKKEVDGTKPPDPKDVAAQIKAAKRSGKADRIKGKDEKPPPIPRGPSPLFVESLRAKVSPFDLMSGHIDGHLEAMLLNGELNADVQQTADELAVNAQWSNLDLSQLEVLEKFLPLPLVGALGGDIELVVPLEKKALKLSEAEGTVGIRVQAASIGPGQIESKKLGAFPYFDVPKTRIDDLGGQIVFGNKKAVFEDFQITGKDLEGEITGYIKLADKFDRWAPRAHLRFKFSDAFMQTHKAVKTAMTSIPYLKRGQRDGYTGLAVSGTMKKLRWQPRKDSPHKRKARSAKPTPDKKGLDKPASSKFGRTGKGTDKPSAATSKTRDRKSLRDLNRGKTGTATGTRPNLGKIDRPTSLPPIVKRSATDTEDSAETDTEDEEDEEEEEEAEEEEGEEGEETKGEDSTKGEEGDEKGSDSEEGDEKGSDTEETEE